ncbi:resolvase [Sandarakinorhabdus cyanobacteriorum]|uniref:Resolvase n=1 Tax=Sandarakinorhabdus cyanobacteriorum TaxID=1981098 RepID=A0A255Y795_9SPHN|nr:recombinase family protein [Sandarakinorhabdus cyanobacteriorum]OYQ25106.1 resolvase [Sandarakinorhabdus cyanobacteriorum]
MLVGYARVSSLGQSLEVQEAALREAGCEKLFAEKRSGTTREGREALREALEFVREGDVLMVTRLDRLARSMGDLQGIIEELNRKGVGFRCLQQGAVDTTSSMGRLVLNMLAAIAEFETDLRKERQREGIDKAKAAGIYKGRPKSIDPTEIQRLHSLGVGATDIAKRLGIGRATVYRALTT